MELKEYQRLARRTAKKLPEREAYEHAVMGIVSDWGEVVTIIKAAVVYGKSLDPGSQLYKDLIKELGDVCWFICYMYDLLGVELDKASSSYLSSKWNIEHANIVQVAFLGAQRIGRISSLIYPGVQEGYNLQPSSHMNIQFNLASIWALVERICTITGLQLETVLEGNISKLRLRYPETYSDEAAIARADEHLTGLQVAAAARKLGEGPY